MATFKIRNFTRYSTEDLVDLVDSIETVIKAERLVRPGSAQVYGKREKYGDELHVVYFHHGMEGERVLPGLREAFPVLRIVRPESLYDSPIQALASATGSSTVPDSVVDDIGNVLFEFYNTGGTSSGWRVRRGLFEKWKKHRGDMAIRILDKVQESESRADRKRWSDRKKASRAVRKGSWAVASIRRNMKLVQQGSFEMQKVEATLLPHERAFHEAVLRFLEHHAAVEKATENLYPQEE